MMLFYAIICRLVPRKLVCMALVHQLRINKLDSHITVTEFVQKVG